MAAIIKRGYIQLDMLPETYPSIIVSEGYSKEYYENIDNTPTYVDYLPLKNAQTNIFSYLMLFYPGFRDGLENAIDNGSHYICNLFGYTRPSKIEFDFSYTKSTNQFICDVRVYDETGTNAKLMDILYLATANEEKLKEYLFTQNKCEIYFFIYAPYVVEPYYNINGTPTGTDLDIMYSILMNDGSIKYRIEHNMSGALSNSYDILKAFHCPEEEKEPNTPVGDYVIPNNDSNVDFPEVPTLSILQGFHRMYSPSPDSMKKIGRALWSPNFFDNVVKLFANPTEAIVSIALSPIEPPMSENNYNIVVGNMSLQTTTGTTTENVTAPAVTAQYATYDFGEIWLHETYRGYLDYNTTVQIYLPFIGVRELSINDVMNKILILKYNVDFFTGDFIALLKCVNPYGTPKSVLYHWNGNFLSHVPFCSSDFSNGILSGLTTSLSIAGGIVTGGSTGMLTALGGGIGSVGGLKPTVDKGGNSSSNVGMLDNFEAYLIVTKPIEDKPIFYKPIKGETINENLLLYKGMGYIVCSDLHLNNIGNALEEEKNELETLLKNGVIL